MSNKFLIICTVLFITGAFSGSLLVCLKSQYKGVCFVPGFLAFFGIIALVFRNPFKSKGKAQKSSAPFNKSARENENEQLTGKPLQQSTMSINEKNSELPLELIHEDKKEKQKLKDVKNPYTSV